MNDGSLRPAAEPAASAASAVAAPRARRLVTGRIRRQLPAAPANPELYESQKAAGRKKTRRRFLLTIEPPGNSSAENSPPGGADGLHPPGVDQHPPGATPCDGPADGGAIQEAAE